MDINPMYVGRVTLGLVFIAISAQMAFRETPELDTVKRRALFRWAYFSFILRGMTFIAFDVFGLFQT